MSMFNQEIKFGDKEDLATLKDAVGLGLLLVIIAAAFGAAHVFSS